MIIAGISGGIGHGKTTFSSYLGAAAASHRHYESSDIIIEVANALRQEDLVLKPGETERDIALGDWLQHLPACLEKYTHTQVQLADLHVDTADFANAPDQYQKLFAYYEAIQTGLVDLHTPISPGNKAQYRQLLQWLGGYIAKAVSGTLWFDEIVRRAQAKPVELVTAGGVRFPGDAASLRTYRDSYILAITRPGIEEADASDVTERERALIKPDTVVINNRSLEALEHCARQVYKDICASSLKSSYTAQA